MAVLYRKYRPQTFSDVLNQKYTLQTLKNQVASGQVSHAYLFTGSRGIGKTSVARIVAKAVNCEKNNLSVPHHFDSAQGDPESHRTGQMHSGHLSSKGERSKVKAPPGAFDGEPCDKCDNCNAITAGQFLDLVEIDAASNTGVDNVRELIEHVKFAPSLGKYKVFIIDEVHMLSKGAFNALLKTLEEPPTHTIFILATTEINKVPATIISRTQRFDFKRLSVEDLLSHLEKIVKSEKLKIPTEVLELIAHNSDGGVRDSLSLLEKVVTLGADATVEESQQLLGVTDIKLSQELVGQLLNQSPENIPEFIDKLLEKGVDFAVFNRDFLEYLRKLLITKTTSGNSTFGLPKEQQAELGKLSNQLSLNDVIFITRLFLKSYKELGSAPTPQIPVLLAALEAQQKIGGKVSSSPVARSSAEYISPSNTELSSKPQTPVVTSVIVEEEEEVPATISMEELEKHWTKIIQKIKSVNGPLAQLVKTSPLQHINGGKIVVGVKFLFHKQNLENAKNQSVISNILNEVTGQKLYLKAELIKEKPENTATTAEVLTDALKIFGGELID